MERERGHATCRLANVPVANAATLLAQLVNIGASDVKPIRCTTDQTFPSPSPSCAHYSPPCSTTAYVRISKKKFSSSKSSSFFQNSRVPSSREKKKRNREKLYFRQQGRNKFLLPFLRVSRGSWSIKLVCATQRERTFNSALKGLT